ncbi:hypothetical protein [Oceanibium sediminis]|uniref:hypothetical protein n=1 Tax=Oceanibium sediminis TaxID=2026339 RepID=UPI000DD46244|nr:hypothetical protein [Oceanibium sediminis]
MFETLFTILIAGCGHDAVTCEVVSTTELSAANIAVCERRLDEILLESAPDWPVASGVCLPSDSARLPEGWTMPAMAVAGTSSLNDL